MAAVSAADASAAAPVPLAEPPSAELLAQVRRIEIRARRLASTLLSGDYRSVFRGSGIEFAETREYVVGDDVRLIDWNVTARMGAPWVKEYVEERELSVVCAVDVSASQLVARSSSGRLGAAAELCALLSFAAVFHHDRAGLLTFTDRVERFVAPAHGPRHVLRIVREVLHPQPARPGTSIAAAADYLARVLPRRSIVVFISDFYDHGYEQPLRTLARRHEVLALTLTDPLDLELPDLGLVEVEDAERGGRLLVDTGDSDLRRRYAVAARVRLRDRRASLAAAGVDEISVRLDQDLVRPLVAYFRSKAARR